MFRKRSKSDAQTEYTCSIRFLDDEPMQLTFKKDTIGQWLYDRVCEKLNLMEKDYFGLRYVDSEKQRHWLDPLKTVYKQLKGVNPMVLCFRVKFYPEDPMKLHEEITRYYLFLQLRRDLHHGRLLCPPDDAVVLAAYIVQSEVGDYDPEDHPTGYISDFKMLPKQTPKLEERVMDQHKQLQGQVPSEAEGNFLKKACTLDTYGVDPHQVKDQRGDQLYLGITHQGIMTFRGSRRTQLYKWTQIRRIAYEGKMFIVHITVNEDEDATAPKKKQQPVGYKCQTAPAAKYLWRCAVEQQLFFTLSSSNTAHKIRSGGTLFSRGSKFRFSGRCQTEAYQASEHIRRTEPNFQRSSSLPNFARRHPADSSRNSAAINRDSLLNETMPEGQRRSYNVIWASGKKPGKRPSSESAVDVPKKDKKPEAEVEAGPVVKAPLAPAESYDEKQAAQAAQAAQATQAAQVAAVEDTILASSTGTVTAALPPRQNGQAVKDTAGMDLADVSMDTTMPYQPDNTFYDDDEDDDEGTQPKRSLEEEIQQLDQHFTETQQNHVAAATDKGVTSVATSTSAATPPKARSKGCGACCVLTTSVFVALILFGVTFYILYFSGLQHLYLTEARNHLQFLEPVRDFVADKANDVAQYFKK